jgi:exopolysaccharide biosynthesis polyprenyl glycosylphosphotransferase
MAQEQFLSDGVPFVEPPRRAWLARALRVPAGALGLCFAERRLLLFAVDLAILSVALLLALWARTAIFHGMEQVMYFPLQPVWWAVLLLVWLPIALVFDLYNLRLAAEISRGTVTAMGCVLVVAAVYLVFPIYSAPLTRSRLAWFLFVAVGAIGVGGWRLAYAHFFREAAFARRVLIVGAGWSGRVLGKEIVAMWPYAGVELVGYVDDNPALRDRRIVGEQRVLGDTHDLAGLVQRLCVNDVVVAITNTEDICPELMQSLIDCWIRGTSVVPMSVYYEQVSGAIPAQHLGQNLFALVGAQTGVGLRLWLIFRRVMDLVVGLAGLAVTVVLFPIIALAIEIESPGPVLYSQERVGWRGRRFRLFKFRSMVPNAEQGQAVWASRDDPRRTRVGTFLRRTRLDELPQFWNLVNGTMTLIGPRPERPEFVEKLTAEVPYFPIRHSVQPGLTGWAQVRFRYGSSVDDALSKLCYDLYYIKRRGPAMDALICLYTLRVMVRMEGS